MFLACVFDRNLILFRLVFCGFFCFGVWDGWCGGGVLFCPCGSYFILWYWGEFLFLVMVWGWSGFCLVGFVVKFAELMIFSFNMGRWQVFLLRKLLLYFFGFFCFGHLCFGVCWCVGGIIL